MIRFFKWLFGAGNSEVRYARIDVKMLLEMPPGQVKGITDELTGHSWGLMHLEDLDHILAMARLQRIPLKAETDSTL